MDYFFNSAAQLNEFNTLVNSFREGSPCGVTGVCDVHKAHFIASLAKEFNDKKILCIVPDEASGERICDDINAMYGNSIASTYPAKDIQLLADVTSSEEYNHKRLSALARILDNKSRILVASAEAALQTTVPLSVFSKRRLTVEAGKTLDTEEFLKHLISIGYNRVSQVEGIGQFSMRGSIIDIYPVGENPIRIELWGDDIDSISYFDTESQRRTDLVDKINIYPAREVLFESTDEAVKAIEELSKRVRSKNAEKIKQNLQHDAENIDMGIYASNSDKYISLAYEKPATVFDYFDSQLGIMCEMSSVKDRATSAHRQHTEDIKLLIENGDICKNLVCYMTDYNEMLSSFAKLNCAYFDLFARQSVDSKIDRIINVSAMQNSAWGGEVKLLCEEINSFTKRGFSVLVLAGTEKTARTLASDLKTAGLSAEYNENPKKLLVGKVWISEGTLTSGFEYPDAKIAVISHIKVNKTTVKAKIRRKKGEQINSLSEIEKGDLVVHVSHGIGKYEGVEQLTVQGAVKDYIKIKYSGSDVLYVPVTQLDLVSRYIGAKEDTSVKLNSLNSIAWQKTRNRVRGAVRVMAQELIELYAKRIEAKGYSFSKDTEWQREFEERFEYRETDDQIKSIDEIKADMERSSPMDRLLCGDVGFGKTEVALRAAFKCVMDSKQVALLVPTTVLALQHYQTIQRRLGTFPMTVELLSRFRTPKQQKEIKNKLRNGEIDIVVGTHSILQKDIEFKDLGLVIIDEEQRFGVTHKEKLKERFVGVDCLSLSATPIPRTLNMAMSGIRDMSVISEPPEDRHPVQTYVIEYDDKIIEQALIKELRRGGQVYYIHNRIETITQCASKIAQLVPEARVGIAHGRMGEEELVEVWRQLLEHEIDILVCTTIIETGVDVQNCNTLIIENAENMGLSQLYQLRGRVGRINRRAYAYFTFARGKVLTEIASKRLEAIREFTQFGSGFRVAMRDLEIRGAGSILGERQHGHMEAVGYDMYLRLLSEEIAKQRGETPPPSPEDCLVDIGIDAHIPESYIESGAQRIEIYRRLASIRTSEDASDIIDEIIDRYGDPPKAVTGLIDVALLRNTAEQLGITEINQRGNLMLFYMKDADVNKVGLLMKEFKGRVMLSAADKPYISVKINQDDPLSVMKNVLSELSS